MPTIGWTEEGAAIVSKLEGLDEDIGGFKEGHGWDGEEDGDEEREKTKERRASNRAFAVARMKEKGRVGSCVGG